MSVPVVAKRGKVTETQIHLFLLGHIYAMETQGKDWQCPPFKPPPKTPSKTPYLLFVSCYLKARDHH